MENLSNGMHAPEPVEFVEIVEELEDAFGRRLRGEGRAQCLSAFLENRDGFARVASAARRRGRSLGLLCRMVADGEHLLGATMRGSGRCVICGEEVPDALFRGGQWWCPEHEAAA